MKNLLHCHSKNLHSFPISLVDGYYRRVFYAESNHNMWKPFEVAIHPHHVDIKLTVLDGELYNPLYEKNNRGKLFKKFKWNSHILNGNGGFEFLGDERLAKISACELHTIEIKKGQMCVWLIEETIPTCEYFPINYSTHDLTLWKPDGLYVEVEDAVRDIYLARYYNSLKYQRA
jgi:hypothetical protein